MKFTGKNLQLVAFSLGLAIDEINNMIGMCPDVFDYADDIEAHEKDKAAIERLKERVDKAVVAEQLASSNKDQQ